VIGQERQLPIEQLPNEEIAGDLGDAIRIRLQDVTDHRVYEGTVRSLVIAGFTGRDVEAVARHETELRILGIPGPDSIPAFYVVPPSLLTSGDEIVVDGDFTSGEVEAVLVILGDNWLLAVGSDHTDRAMERRGIQLAKEACRKVIGGECVRIDRLEDWDSLELRSWLDDETACYQEGTMAEILPLPILVERATQARGKLKDGDVMFLGTLPVSGSLRPSTRFTGELGIPSLGRTLRTSYSVQVAAEVASNET
jgi:uncharacterized protein DUF2848